MAERSRSCAARAIAGFVWPAMALVPCPARAEEAPDTRSWQAEVKRQATNRGTADESTRTTLRIESLGRGLFALLRLDLPFPDEKTDFEGSPFHPRPGDLKVRAALQPSRLGGFALSPFLDITFPTAHPDSLGSGKVQLAPGFNGSHRLGPVDGRFGTHEFAVTYLAQQVVSVAGDESRKDINHTKLELGIRDTWRKDYSLKLTFKPVIDWVQDGKTGAVGELEGAVELSRQWRVQLMAGGLLWGAGVASTYGARVELTLRHRF